jgi:hypothetical protein
MKTIVTKKWFESKGFSVQTEGIHGSTEFIAAILVNRFTELKTIKYVKNRGFDTFLVNIKNGETRTLSDEENCEKLTVERMSGLLKFFEIDN